MVPAEMPDLLSTQPRAPALDIVDGLGWLILFIGYNIVCADEKALT